MAIYRSKYTGEEIDERLGLAENARKAIFIDNKEAMEAFIAEHSSELKAGDAFVLRDDKVSDFWWNGEAAVEMKGKVDLSSYLTAEETTAIFATKDEVNDKQPLIADLEAIRSGAKKGDTSVQPAELETLVHKTGDETIDGYKKFKGGVSMENRTLSNIGDPSQEGDAVNKRYVDSRHVVLELEMGDETDEGVIPILNAEALYKQIENAPDSASFYLKVGTVVIPATTKVQDEGEIVVTADSEGLVVISIVLDERDESYIGYATVIPLALKSDVDDKQDTIPDLDIIRSGAAAGAAVPDWAKQPQKPTLSELSNDAGFITKLVSDLTNYYDKDTVDQMVEAIKQFDVKVVDTLPTASAETMRCIYLVPASESKEGNVKDEYITIQKDGIYAWEKIGSTDIDLSEYATKEQLQSLEYALYNDDESEGKIGDIVALSKDLEATQEKIEEIQLFKSPNVTTVGELNVNHGQVSGFSRENYMVLPFLFDATRKRFELSISFVTGSDVTTAQNVLGSKLCMAAFIANSKLNIRVSSNGTAWNIIDWYYPDKDLRPNHPYYVTISFDGINYSVKLSEDGKTYDTIYNVGSNQWPFAGLLYLGVGNNYNNPFLGTINLNKCELLFNGEHFWEGMDDAGLATRMDKDMSNISTEGVNKVKEIAGEDFQRKLTPGEGIEIDANGKISSTAGGNVDFEEVEGTEDIPEIHVISDAPKDGETYGRNSGEWVKVQGGDSGKHGVISQTITYNSNGIRTYSNVVSGTIPQLSIDLFISAGAEFNDSEQPITKTAPWGEDVQHLAGYFYLNGLGDISYQEMLKIYNYGDIYPLLSIQYYQYQWGNIRTFLFGQDMRYTYNNYGMVSKPSGSAFTNTFIDCFGMPTYMGSQNGRFVQIGANMNSMFQNNSHLSALCLKIDSCTSATGCFQGCTFLQHLRLWGLKFSLDLKDCKLITDASIKHLVDNAANTSAISVTLHADAYANLSQTTKDAATAKNINLQIA